MRIKLDKTHYLVSDPYSYWVVTVVKSKDTGKEYDRRVSGYHFLPQDAISSYIDKEMRASEVEKLSDLIKEVEKLKKQIKSWKIVLEKESK